MAVEQPLTAFSEKVSDATLAGIDALAPAIRRVHAALDRCAEQSGPLRYEAAVFATLSSGEGGFLIAAQTPDATVKELFDVAPAAAARFAEVLPSAPAPLSADTGSLVIGSARVEVASATIHMDTFLAILENDPQTTPSSLEGLFEDLEKAAGAGLIEMTAGTLSLTGSGRKLLERSGPILGRLGEAAIERIDLHAQEVADGRMSLRDALSALGGELELELCQPGSPDAPRVATMPRQVDPDTGVDLFGTLLMATATLTPSLRSAVMTSALHTSLLGWGLDEGEAETAIRTDTRVLRVMGASLSHGPLRMEEASAIVAAAEADTAVAHASRSVTPEMLQALAGPGKRAEREPPPSQRTPVAPSEHRRSGHRWSNAVLLVCGGAGGLLAGFILAVILTWR